MKSNMAASGKFESENERKSNPVLSDTEILFSCFPTNFKIRLYFQQFNVNLFQQWRFPLKLLTVSSPLLSCLFLPFPSLPIFSFFFSVKL